MLRLGSENKYERPYGGPHRILWVNTNGTVKLQIGAVTDTITIRRLHPYKDASSPVHGGSAICVKLRKDEQSKNDIKYAETDLQQDKCALQRICTQAKSAV
jgi:hypothetical protein